MNYIGKFISNFKDFYNEINAATLTGEHFCFLFITEAMFGTSLSFQIIASHPA